MEKTVLIVDDEMQLAKLIGRKLTKAGLSSVLAHKGSAAIDLFKRKETAVVILDYMLPDMTGLQVLEEMKRLKPDVPVIMMTAYGNVESAVGAMKLGAVDYLNKPMELEEVKDLVMKQLDTKVEPPPKENDPFVFQSPEMKRVMAFLNQVKDTDASILVLGESGVGKTALAHWIHSNSYRGAGPMLSINCAAIPEHLLESELFGYQKGAFTGAVTTKIGKFAAADKGTIFLDEIGEISPSMQAKLLHVIEDKKVMQLGSNEYRTVDVRIITATNKDLKKSVAEGMFREDLYYRLNLIEIEIPPLRERMEDIPLFIQSQMKKLNRKYKKQIYIAEECINLLLRHTWPGNIRELLNMLERIHIVKREGTIMPEDLAHASLMSIPKDEPVGSQDFSGSLSEVLEDIEEKMIRQALGETNGNQTKAADRLGIARHTLIYKMKKIGISL
ncbi:MULTISPECIES: sigma-54 dependent transcriptional regulator [Bacillaceae]|uniref:sigma-54-dependent transcriptional regulator n=1 Tax=Bacillales TaxID=1385 RepID=UPI001883F3C3|nr:MULTISPECIES: sigma-54 dependent transcriptional regulator [Bacillaceae]MBF0707933.1 sigma-54-dependent Fis family transcriptional regulator [Pseudalkalibacillus hwajinpoensis]MDO6654312.1 sigma-54 dependent transcriptional regulator [Anaerobacillus sp. 1_MG-2023]